MIVAMNVVGIAILFAARQRSAESAAMVPSSSRGLGG